ncbi:hypothetical protein TRVL_05449 [Trypanosoma vivax]|uniref:Uncharacterized protein n=1 Tax=Trypanosoma vivax (strain Y486) TaxID=1055687 RepID=G0U993_TRYVY|nr:hypothetical protein TRVL_05449 [Trypanosoma vivax]CCC54178.1 conserved hypothetical protein [Trypanosoma vivax Y486]
MPLNMINMNEPSQGRGSEKSNSEAPAVQMGLVTPQRRTGSVEMGSSSSIKIDYKRLMESHTRRTRVIEQYKRLVEDRRMHQNRKSSTERQDSVANEDGKEKSMEQQEWRVSDRVEKSLAMDMSKEEQKVRSKLASESTRCKGDSGDARGPCGMDSVQNRRANGADHCGAAIPVERGKQPQPHSTISRPDGSAVTSTRVSSSTRLSAAATMLSTRCSQSPTWRKSPGAISVAPVSVMSGNGQNTSSNVSLSRQNNRRTSISSRKRFSCSDPFVSPSTTTVSPVSEKSVFPRARSVAVSNGRTKASARRTTGGIPTSTQREHYEVKRDDDPYLTRATLLGNDPSFAAVHKVNSVSPREGSPDIQLRRFSRCCKQEEQPVEQRTLRKVEAYRRAAGEVEEPSLITSATANTIGVLTPLFEDGLRSVGKENKEEITISKARKGRHIKSEIRNEPIANGSPFEGPLESEKRNSDSLTLNRCDVSGYVSAEKEVGEGQPRVTVPLRLSTGSRLTIESEKSPPLRKSQCTAASLHSNPSAASEGRSCLIASAAALLRGVLTKTRRVLPCYYCGVMQPLDTYRLHIDFCHVHTTSLCLQYGLNPLRLSVGAPMQCISASASTEELTTFTRASYANAKISVVPCPGCGKHLRIHDLPVHLDTCCSVCTNPGRTSNGSSKR